jgi:hypothetical protein
MTTVRLFASPTKYGTGSRDISCRSWIYHHCVIEVAVRWIEIGLKAATGATALHIDLSINDRNPKTGECAYFDWCGLKDFHDPSGFGELVLQGETRCTPRSVTGVRTIS